MTHALRRSRDFIFGLAALPANNRDVPRNSCDIYGQADEVRRQLYAQ